MARGALFTIGYEGRSPDEYFALLKEARVTLLADLRANPNSRKKGFAKRALAERSSAEGIRYEHLPELGIVSAKRKGVKTRADYDALFERYEREWLPENGEALDRIRAWLRKGERVALTCFEKAPEECHRHCVVEALDLPAKHLGAEET